MLNLRKPEFPRKPRMLYARERRSARAAVVAANEHDVRLALCNARSYRSNAYLRDELYGYARVFVCVAQVVYKLCEVFD